MSQTPIYDQLCGERINTDVRPRHRDLDRATHQDRHHETATPRAARRGATLAVGTDHGACHRRPVSTYPHLPRPNTIRALTHEGNAPQPCLQSNTREQQHHDSLAIYQQWQAVILPSRQAPRPASRMHSGKQVRFRRTNP